MLIRTIAERRAATRAEISGIEFSNSSIRINLPSVIDRVNERRTAMPTQMPIFS